MYLSTLKFNPSFGYHPVTSLIIAQKIVSYVQNQRRAEMLDGGYATMLLYDYATDVIEKCEREPEGKTICYVRGSNPCFKLVTNPTHYKNLS